MTSSSDSRDVAIAVIKRKDSFLIAQRRQETSFGGYWEFPGGKPEAGETLEICLVREIQEEMGIRIQVGELLRVIAHDYPEGPIRLHCFWAKILEGDPKPIDSQAVRWVGSGELSRYTFPPASAPLIAQLQTEEKNG